MTTNGKKATKGRQLAWVFDLNKCIGCQTCSVACKVLWNEGEAGTEHAWWMTVNTQPGRGTPKDWEKMGGGYRNGNVSVGKVPTKEEFGGGWDYNYEEVLHGGKGSSVHLQKTAGSKTWGPNWDEDEGGGVWPNAYYFYLPRLCNHCTDAPCVEACPTGAMFKREEDGLVLRNEDVCEGNQQCSAVCPYKKIYFNEVRGVSQHCIGCFPRIEKGVAPACVRQCPGRAVFIGFIDDKTSLVHKFVNEWKLAVPLHPEFNTKPNVFYVPPLSPAPLNADGSPNDKKDRIPPEYLESLFGPDVHKALANLKTEVAKKRRGEASQALDALILYEWKDALGPFTKDPAEIVWR